MTHFSEGLIPWMLFLQIFRDFLTFSWDDFPWIGIFLTFCACSFLQPLHVLFLCFSLGVFFPITSPRYLAESSALT